MNTTLVQLDDLATGSGFFRSETGADRLERLSRADDTGRLVPLELMPDWVQRIADVLPFASTFGFPIESLVADLTTRELLTGLAVQVGWIAVSTVACALVWKRAVRRYAAVGN